MLESSNRAAQHSKNPSIFEYEGKIEEREDEDQQDKGPNQYESFDEHTATLKNKVEQRIIERDIKSS
jgi:hypothetical protein